MEQDSRKEVISNLPNRLSLFRMVCIPVVVVCLYIPGRWGSFLAALFLGMAFITDFLDGFYARKYGAVTVLGKFLDPLADKILVSSTLIMLMAVNRVPAWVVILIIARELAITGLRSIAVSEGVVIQASSLGKYKTIFQSVATLGLCLHYDYFNIDFHVVGMLFLWVALILTLWSGWAYLRQFNTVFFPENK
jgi:CDP-diacylglycerol--glycerol-3-phosphate 3-phosphatidyltransferase